jgi:RNA polymerase sigma-70 factor (subfamily 1)
MHGGPVLCESLMTQPPTESELIARAIAGDSAAAQELLLLHYDRLSSRLSVGLPSDLQGTLSVEDVLQEAFTDAVRGISTFVPRGEGAFFAWLATIADHRLLDLIRAARAVKRGGGRSPVGPAGGEASTVGDLLALLAAEDHTPSRSVAGHEAAAAVQSALSGLKDEYRDVLRLRYFDGLSVSETAARMGRSESAIHMLCHRAVAQLRDVLGSASQYFSKKP